MIRISVWAAIFLVLLRIGIGWHFFFEGYGKVRSANLGKDTVVNEKPFSSESYFRESESPFGKFIKSKLVDPDQAVIDRLTLRPVEGDASKAPPLARFPEALAAEWDDYFSRFVAEFRLDESQKSVAEGKLNQSKAKVVQWIQGLSDEKDKDGKHRRIVLTVKRRAPGGGNSSADFEEQVTVAERAAELKKKSEDVRAAYSRMDHLGKDVDAASLRALKAEVAAIRKELEDELKRQKEAMQNALAKVLDTRVTAYAAEADNKDAAATLQAMLTPMQGGVNPLARMWDEYAAYVKDFAPDMNDGRRAEIDLEVQAAKVRFDRWLADQDRYTGEPLPVREVAQWRKHYAAASARKDPDAAQEKKLLESRMQAELKSQSDAMRAQIGTPLLGNDRAKGHAPKSDEQYLGMFPKDWTLIDYIDWSTRWFLTIVGALLMVGLLTRLSSFAAAVFLLLTILTQPSVPWLPAPPNSEGNYLFVNKNVIEMIALLVLMTTRTGKWFGLDAVVSSIFKRR